MMCTKTALIQKHVICTFNKLRSTLQSIMYMAKTKKPNKIELMLETLDYYN